MDSTLIAEQSARIDKLQEQIQSLSAIVGRLRQEINVQSKNQETLGSTVTNLSEGLRQTNENVQSASESMENKVSEAKGYIDSTREGTDKKIATRTWIGGIIGVLLFLLVGLIYSLLKKRITRTADTIDAVKKAQVSLQEESIKLDEKLVSLFDSQLAVKPVQGEDHSLVLKIANELARMETNLSRMDPSVKGYKQLGAAVKRIKENLSANGYEFVDMLGRPYHEGMVVDADFVSNEDLDEGTQIISGVSKPQVNYNGKMIQSAKITVSQNV